MTIKEFQSQSGLLNIQGLRNRAKSLFGRTFSASDKLTNGQIKQLCEYYETNTRVNDKIKKNIEGIRASLPADVTLVNASVQDRQLTFIQRIRWEGVAYLLILVGIIAVQAYHFAVVIGDAATAAGRHSTFWINYFTGLAFEATALILTINENRKVIETAFGEMEKRMIWLWVFAAGAFFTNSYFYKLWEPGMIGYKVIGSLTLPIAILAFSHIFTKKV